VAGRKAKADLCVEFGRYDEFVASFGGEAEEGPSSGGRGGGIRTAGKGFVRAGGASYNPLAQQQTANPQSQPLTLPDAAAGLSHQPEPRSSGVPAGLRRAGPSQSQARPTVAAMVEDDDDEVSSLSN